jgi:predicted glycosyltransferase
MEQTLRAECFHKRNLLDYIPWKMISPELLREKVDLLLQKPEAYLDTMSTFQMTGFDVMRQRIREFRKQSFARSKNPILASRSRTQNPYP